jgi:hypothetical protein
MWTEGKMLMTGDTLDNGPNTQKPSSQNPKMLSAKYVAPDVQRSPREQTISFRTAATLFDSGTLRITRVRARVATMENPSQRGLILEPLTDADAVDFNEERFVA